MKNNCIVSTGGLGDSLIILSKIKQMDNVVEWIHGSGHEVHLKPISDIQNCLHNIKSSREKITKKTRQDFEERCKKHCKQSNLNYVRLNTKIIEMDHPFLDKHLVIPKLRNTICVQMTAGRLGDNTKRTVDLSVIDYLANTSSQKVVMIGPEKIEFCHKNVINVTGQTKTILEALQYVGGCDICLSHDGLIAYYAAMLEKKCVINYHISTLTNHYWHPLWAKHVKPIFVGSVVTADNLGIALNIIGK